MQVPFDAVWPVAVARVASRGEDLQTALIRAAHEYADLRRLLDQNRALACQDPNAEGELVVQQVSPGTLETSARRPR